MSNSNSLNEQVKALLSAGEKETNIRKFVRKELGLGKSQGNAVYNKIKNQLYFPSSVPPVSTSKSDDGNGLSFVSDKYCYNQNTDTYVINLKNHKAPLCISGAKHRAICRSYSSWIDDLTANEICVKYSLTPEVFSEYRKIFGLTKDREPLSIEEIVADTIDGNIQSIIEEKRFKIYQGYEKELWKDTQNKANKWDNLTAKTLDTLRASLESWNGPECESSSKNVEVKNGLTFCASISDSHIGEIFNKNEAFYGKEFNSKIACQIMDDYFDKIYQTVSSRSDKFSLGAITILGDYLHSCIGGFTRKGTHVHSEVIDQEMFRIGLDALIRFINNFSNLFPETKVYVTVGNHDSVILTYLVIAAEKYFNPNPNIEFIISDAWASLHKINNVAVVMTHGGLDKLNQSLPPISPRLKTFIQQLFLTRAEEIVDCKSRIVISGHKHVYSHIDMGSFDFYCFGSSVRGNNYSDSLGLYSTPRQNCLILGDGKVLETLHYYF